MAAPKFAPVAAADRAVAYESPDHIPGPWLPDRPGEIDGRQPAGDRLGYQGPDQGYGLLLAARCRDRLQLQPGESADDAIHGCLGIALRRASLFGRAPVIHDFTVAFTIWGFLDREPPNELIARRRQLFEGVGNAVHHYAEGRLIADLVPESTLRMTPSAVAAAFPERWRELTGA
jgi:hypothetical protein